MGKIVLFFILQNLVCRLHTAHYRHLHIHKDHIVAIGLTRLKRLFSIVGKRDIETELLQYDTDKFLVDGVVFGNQDLKRLRLCFRRFLNSFRLHNLWLDGNMLFCRYFRCYWLLRLFEGNCKVECRPLALFALYGKFSPHRADDLLRNRQPKPGTARFSSRTGTRLGIGIEDLCLLFFTQSDTRILHCNPQNDPALFVLNELRTYIDASAGFCKFDGVADKVGDDLGETGGVTLNLAWNLRIDGKGLHNMLLVKTRSEKLDRSVYFSDHIERNALKLHLPGVEFGDFQNIVYDDTQVVRTVTDK